MTPQAGRKSENSGPERSKAASKARKPPELPCPTEEQESLALSAWARMMVETNQEPRLKLLRCGFEGLRLPMGLRMKVKRQSVSTGWPDWWLSVCNENGLGLYVELKRERGGTVSGEQLEMHNRLREQGYRVAVCKGSDQAIRVIRAYLGMK